jgi:nicotinate-nucleotide adenylyltransferase
VDLVLLYGGTFDPVHAGHLAVARAARDELGAPVHLLPAADPPHRAATGADAAQRERMLELAITDKHGTVEPGLVVDRRELARAGASYTVDTLREVRAELGPDAPLAWITGDDSFRSLPDWHGWEALFELAHFVVALRPGHSLDPLPPALAGRAEARWVDTPAALRASPAGSLYRLHFPPRPESASAIRRALADGRTPAGLPAAVEQFIRVTGLYGTGV